MGPLADLFSYSSAMTACDLREEWQVTVALLAELRRKSMQAVPLCGRALPGLRRSHAFSGSLKARL